jgi:hypothetical protein
VEIQSTFWNNIPSQGRRASHTRNPHEAGISAGDVGALLPQYTMLYPTRWNSSCRSFIIKSNSLTQFRETVFSYSKNLMKHKINTISGKTTDVSMLKQTLHVVTTVTRG